ncbi:MAG TPA: thioredoxin family protein [Microbacterium sp.]|nr:thioredoxin family protein [Microbacterium sp.]
MDITLQYFDGCPNWKVLDGRLAEVLADRTDVPLTYQRIETPDDAARLGFHGSPTVLIDGTDPFAEPGAPVGLACRMFRTPDGAAGAPTVEQLRAAIEDAARLHAGVARS